VESGGPIKDVKGTEVMSEKKSDRRAPNRKKNGLKEAVSEGVLADKFSRGICRRALFAVRRCRDWAGR